MKKLALLFAAVWLAAASAAAQISLPQVPQVGGVLDRVPDAGDAVTSATESVRDVRRLRIRDLLRQHGRELEADPDGQPIVRSQILALAPNAAALDAARAAGFEIVRSDEMEAGALVTLRAPPRMSTRRALEQLREADPQGTYDFDHLHIESGAAPVVAMAQQGAGARARIGLIDSGVAAHESLNGAIAAQRGFSGENAIPAAHGTAVASLIVNAAPGARIYVADIYGGAPTGGASSALARALSWLASERVPVINVSLVGPRNRIVEAVVARLGAQGFLIIAAVGNDGPAAPPLYPASYAHVVGVTGVDARGRVLNEAGRGAQVDFAALGATRAAAPRDRAAPVRGTSYAAPVVAALLATRMSAPGEAEATRALAGLRAQARDLGPRGRDNTYGDGLVESSRAVAVR